MNRDRLGLVALTLLLALPTTAFGSSVRDEFNEESFGNNDGSTDWSGHWIENDADGAGSTAGAVRVIGGELRLDDYPDTATQPSAAREVDLTGATTATLSFDYRTSHGVDADDAIAVEVSSNGGASFVVLEVITGVEGPWGGSESHDIFSFKSSETVIRFRVANKYGSSDEHFFVDNVDISFSLMPAAVPGLGKSGVIVLVSLLALGLLVAVPRLRVHPRAGLRPALRHLSQG